MITFPSSPVNGQIYSTDKYDYIWDATANKWLQKQANPSAKHKLLNDTSTIALDLSQDSSFEIHTTGQSLDTEVSFTNPPTESGKFAVKVKNDYDLPKQAMQYTGNSFDFLIGEMGEFLSSVSGQWFKPDGTRMFIGDSNRKTIYQFDLTKPWDIQSRVYAGVKFDMSAAGISTFRTFSFDNDGTRIFAVNGADSVLHQIDLTTAWDLSTAVDNNISVSLETILGETFTSDATIQVTFNYNDENPGTKMFFIANVTNRILYEVEMVTPWDIVNAQYAGASANLTALVPSIQSFDITFNQDGTKFFTCDWYSTRDNVSQFSLVSAYSVASGVTYNSLYNQDTYTGEATPTQIYFKPDYTKYWIAGPGKDSLYEFDLTDPNDITTSSYTGNYVRFYNFTLADSLRDAQFSVDGKTLYVLTATIGAIYQFDLRIPFDISSAVFANKSSNLVNTYDPTTESFYISPDGVHVYTVRLLSDAIVHFTMTTPGDISTLAYVESILKTSLPSGNGNSRTIWFKPDGTRLFMSTSPTIYWWDLPTPWDIASATTQTGSYDFNSYTSATTLNTVYCISFSNRGDTLYFLEQDYDTIFSVELSTPWNPAGGTSAIQTINHNSETASTEGFAMSRDSDKILVLDGSNRYIYEYESLENGYAKTITWPDNLTWEGNTTPEMPLLDQSKVFDIYTTDGGTTYQGVERISAAYNLSSLIE